MLYFTSLTQARIHPKFWMCRKQTLKDHNLFWTPRDEEIAHEFFLWSLKERKWWVII